MSDEDLLEALWHWRLEDGLGWTFCAGILKQNYDIDMEPQTVKARFERAIKKYNENK